MSPAQVEPGRTAATPSAYGDVVNAAIVGAVVLGMFVAVVLAVALVERSIRRARERQAAWDAVVERLRPAMAAVSTSFASFGVTFAEAAKAASDFSRSMRNVEEAFAAGSDDIARLAADARRLSSGTTT